MSTINLVAEKQESNQVKILSGSAIGSITALVLVMLLYGGLVYANKYFDGQYQSVHAEYTDEYGKFISSNGNAVIDFKKRGDLAANLIKNDQPASNIFSQLESSILPSVYLDSLSYDKSAGTLSLNCAAPNFQTESEQVLSFQNSGAFTLSSLGKGVVNPSNGLVNFSIVLKIK